MRRARRVLVSLLAVVVALTLGVTLAPSATAYPAGVPGTATINATTFAPGDTVTVRVAHTTPGALTMVEFPGPVTIGSGSVGRQGNGVVKGQVPSGFRGDGTIQVEGAGGEIYPFAVRVTGQGVTGGTEAVIPSQTVYDEFHPEQGFGAVDTYASYGNLSAGAGYLYRVTARSDGYTDSTTLTADAGGSISANTRFTYTGTDRAHWHEGETVVFDLVLPATGEVLATSSVVLRAQFSGQPPDSQTNLDDATVLPGQTVHVTGTGYSGGQVTGEISPGSIPGGTYESGILGGLRGSFTVPVGTAAGQYSLQLTDSGPGGFGHGLTFEVLPTPAAGTFVALPPTRVLDTRTGTGAPRARLAAGGVLTLQVTGAGGVPASGAAAVVLNVTVAGATTAGYVTAYPSGTARPVVSNVNYPAGAPISGLATVRVGTGGKVALYNGGGAPIDLVADVAGYFAPGTAGVAGAFVATVPSRVLDTRTANGAPKAKVASKATLAVPVGGRGGVPAGAAAVVLTVTAANATTPGYLTVYPDDGSDRPTASNLNYEKNKPIANQVTVPLGTGGRIAVYNGGTTPVDVLADVAGYYLPGTPTAPGAFVATSPVRLLDTRQDGALQTLSPQQTRSTSVAGLNPVPSTGADAVVLNVTAVARGAQGYTTVYPNTVSPRPVAATVNFGPGQTIADLAVLPIGSDGQIALYNGSSDPLDLVLDVAGYYLS